MTSTEVRAELAEWALGRLEHEYGLPRQICRFEPLEELVCCILSQSSSDASSFPAFTRLLERFPTWDHLALAPADEVAHTIRSAGLAQQKARNIQACLLEIQRRTGEFSLESLRNRPLEEARSWLTSLPGVGPKTAAIVLSFSFGQPAIPVDTHVFRVACRLGLVEERRGAALAHRELEALVRPDRAYACHILLIQHGRHLCDARKPDCGRCPLASRCEWFLTGSKRTRRPPRTNK